MTGPNTPRRPGHARDSARRPAAASEDRRDGGAVVPLAAHGLDRRGADARLGGEPLVEPAHPLHAGVVAAGIGHRLRAHDVVDDDQAAGAVSPIAQVKESGVVTLSASMNLKSDGPAPSAVSRGSVSWARPERPARGRIGAALAPAGTYPLADARFEG